MSTLRAGYARTDISPPFDVSLLGYPGDARVFRPNKDKMLDPLQARAIYLCADSGSGLLILSLDICVIATADATAYRQMIATAVKLPVEQVWLCCTHTHSAPFPRGYGSDQGGPVPERFRNGDLEPDYAYGKWLAERLRKVAKQAVARLSPVKLAMRQTSSGLGYNRRCESAGRILHCWNISEYPDRHPGSVPDLRHTVLRFDYTGKRGGIVLHSIGVHPVVMGKESSNLSGDWPSYSRRHIERRMRDYDACFIQGAGAEIHPWIATQSDPHALRWVGEAIGSEAHLLAQTAGEMQDSGIELAARRIPLEDLGVEIHAVEFGELLALALPFELSSAWAAVIKHELGRPVIFCCLTNGWESYWMSPRQCEDGGYEVEVGSSCGITARHSETLLRVLSSQFRLMTQFPADHDLDPEISTLSKMHE